jgi:hypothetical protein
VLESLVGSLNSVGIICDFVKLSEMKNKMHLKNFAAVLTANPNII